MDTDSFDRIAGQIPLYAARLLRIPDEVKSQAFDIHLKAGGPVSVCGAEGVFFLREGGVTRALTDDLLTVTADDLREVFLTACSHSVFSHEQELREGYLVFGSGCRAGVCGTAVLENGRVKAVRDVTAMVFRIPRNVVGCGDRLFLEGADLRRGVLVAGEPSSGKTTFLRDVARSLSMGKFSPIRRVALIDERGEFLLDSLGPCADVLRGYPKAAGFQLALRMLSPEFLICDELAPADLPAVRGAALSGVGMIASVHAARADFRRRPLCRELLKAGAFGTVVFLSGRGEPGEIEAIEQIEESAQVREDGHGTGRCADLTFGA